MKKITVLLMVSAVLLFGASEKFYKQKYDYYSKKIKELKDESWSNYEKTRELSDYKNQFSFSGANNEAMQTQAEIDEVEQDNKEIDKKISSYKDKLMELKFTSEEELGFVPKWFKEK